MKYQIKPAEPDDAVWIVEEAAKDMIFNEVGRPELYNPDMLDIVTDKVIQDGTGLICWSGDERVGMIGGVLTQHFLIPNYTVLAEVVWYVHPQHRETRASYLLLTGYRKLIDEKADEGIFTLLKHSEIKDESLERLGFSLQEKNYMYRKQ